VADTILCLWSAAVRRATTGVQLTPLWGPLYLRLQLLFDGTAVFEAGLAVKVPVLLSFGG